MPQIFLHQQNIYIVTNYREFKSPTALRKEFRKHFKLSPRQLPQNYVFLRVFDRFVACCDVSPYKLPGPPRTKIIEENNDTVRNLVEEKLNTFISEESTAMNVSTATMWKILMKTLRKYPHKPKMILSLTADLRSRVCRIQFTIGFYSKIKNSAITLCGLMKKSCRWKNSI